MDFWSVSKQPLCSGSLVCQESGFSHEVFDRVRKGVSRDSCTGIDVGRRSESRKSKVKSLPDVTRLVSAKLEAKTEECGRVKNRKVQSASENWYSKVKTKLSCNIMVDISLESRKESLNFIIFFIPIHKFSKALF